jgi:hypothetical protein
MHADNGTIDNLDSGVMGSGECVYEAAPHMPASPSLLLTGGAVR